MSEEREHRDVLEPGKQAGKKDEKKDDKAEIQLRDEPPVVSAHQIKLGRTSLTYHTTAGMMPLKDAKGEIEAQIFFMAYTLDSPDGDPKRPLTFAFNGGPGSSSIWLHMGALGPKRVGLNPDGTTPPPPYRLVDNDETWLTETDLVFIDPVGTGFSRAKSEEIAEKYWSYNKDIESVGEFIRLYLTRYGRWTSPLFLAGESYGTIRASGLAGHLIDKGIAFNGILLVSATTSYMTLSSGDLRGLDLPYVLYLPTYTATAWYHKQLPDDLQQRDLRDVLAEVEQWAMSDYLVALAQGDALAGDRRAEITRQLARYTGLSEEYVDGSRLRIHIMRFCKELLRRRRMTVGRIDSRFTGVDDLAVTEEPDFDPSLSNAAWASVFNDYVRRELGYKTDTEYEILSMKVNEKWKFDSVRMGFLDTGEALRKAFARNPYMRVFVAFGYYDLATVYQGIVYNIDHIGLEPAWRANVCFAGYEGGHMMYVDDTERVRLKRDVSRFMRDAVPTS
jgi:carboxypeptidase C (cathepsin A)